MIYIYVIKHPITLEVVYVGKTKNIKERFRKHLSYKRKTYLSKWIKGLKEKNSSPLFEIIESVNNENWQDKEKDWIKFYRSIGLAKMNMTDGGDGGNTMGGRHLTADQKNKISSANKGRIRADTIILNKMHKGIPVIQTDMNGVFIKEHQTIKDAARYINRCDRRIQMMCKGNTPKEIIHVGGFKFRYKNQVHTKQQAV